jgi:hypothetical protein
MDTAKLRSLLDEIEFAALTEQQKADGLTDCTVHETLLARSLAGQFRQWAHKLREAIGA